MRSAVLFIPIVLLAGCASQPGSTSSAAHATAARAPAPAASVPATATAGAGEKATPAATDPVSKAPPGYRLVERDGVILYCQKLAKVGTRLAKESCMTRDAYEDMARRAETDRQNFRKNSTLCGSGGCGGG